MNIRPLIENPALADLACKLLRTPNAPMAMDEAETRTVVSYMQLVNMPQGTIVFRDGDQADNAHMLLLLTGEVVVEAGVLDGVPLSVLGPGNMIGEMGLLDGSPRSSTCTAATPIQAAGLTRKALEMLIEKHPKAGAKLMVSLSNRMSERLRAMSDQLRLYASITPPDAPTVKLTIPPGLRTMR